MKTAEASIYLDTYRPKKSGLCAVKIKVSFNRKRKYFSTGIDLTESEFEKIFSAQRRTKEQKAILKKLNDFLTKANKSIDKLTVFSFPGFENLYLEQRNLQQTVSIAFDEYIEQLKQEGRISTAESFKCAKASIEAFKKNLSFIDITPKFLNQYENWMLKKNRSESTIGIYLRSLRAVFKKQNIDKSLYPFGKDRYEIPTSRNIKKALTVEEIARIFQYEAPPNSTKDMAKDYWLFMYLCNGMNVKDMCLLKWGNVNGQMITYHRAKTKRSRKDSSGIKISLKPETWEIIKKWGQPSISKDAYIFPHFQAGMSAERELKACHQLTKTINKYIKQIADEVGINKNVTTYFARHSFATVLKNSGANISMISELLGHSSTQVTTAYLGSFEDDQIHKQTAVLTAGLRKAN